MTAIDRRELPSELRQAAVLLSEWLNGGGVPQVRPRSCDNLRAAADEIDRLREAVSGVIVVANSGALKDFEGEPWLARVLATQL